jgi:hypothetical protein
MESKYSIIKLIRPNSLLIDALFRVLIRFPFCFSFLSSFHTFILRKRGDAILTYDRGGDYTALTWKVKINLSLCLTNSALLHEGVWGSRCIDPHFLTSVLVAGERSASRPWHFTPKVRAPCHWIGRSVGHRSNLNDMKKRKFLTLPGLELRPLGRPTSSQSLYRLCYSGSATLTWQGS